MSLGEGSQPNFLPCRGLVNEAGAAGAFAWTGRVCGLRTNSRRGGGLPTGPP